MEYRRSIYNRRWFLCEERPDSILHEGQIYPKTVLTTGEVGAATFGGVVAVKREPR